MATNYKALKESGFMQQIQKDHFSMRLRVVGGNVTAKQLAVIAQISETYGHGYVHLTSRQSVEIPFIKLDTIDQVRAILEENEMHTGVCGPGVRTVTACQGSAICGSGCIDTYPLAVEIADRYLGQKLPHKFKVGVTGCMNNCLKAEENDLGVKGVSTVEWIPSACTLCKICIKACRKQALSLEENQIRRDEETCNHCGRCAKVCPFDAWNTQPGYLLSFGGTFGNLIAKGKYMVPIIRDKETLFRVADAALRFFEEHGSPKERFRVAIERVGWDLFQTEIERAYQG